MKVALISHSFPPFMTGGIGSYTFSLAKALSKKGIDVTVFCGGKVNEELDVNFKIRRLPMLDFPPRAVWFQLQNYKTLIKELKNFDIIHGQNTTSTFYTYMRNKIKKPWIVTFHDCPIRGLKAFIDSPIHTKNIGDLIFNVIEYPLYKKLYSIDLRNADNIIAVSNSLLLDLHKNFNFNLKKAKVIQNGVDIDRINRIISRIKKKKNKRRRLIFLGRLFYSKGLTFLIDAIQEVIKSDKNVVLDIYGDGPLKRVIQKKIFNNQLSDYIKLHPSAPNEKIIKEIYKSDVFILPSLYEAFSIVILEAMACSKPVITSNVNGMKELVENKKEGLLVPPKNPRALAKAIIKILRNPKLAEKMGENGYKKVKENYTWNIQENKTIEVYKEVLKEHNKNENNDK